MPRKPDLRLAGLGVDIVSASRAARFLEGRKKEALSHVLSPAEIKRFAKNPASFEFSKIFTAKEAFFKASQCPPGGVYAFSQLEVKLLPNDAFEIEWLAPGSRYPKARGSHFVSETYVGAEIILWESPRKIP